jgi:hypothetical protein
MYHRKSAFRGLIMVALASVAFAVAGCGSASSGSASPNTLLSQTFTGTHKVTSGNLNLTLTINPSGSSVLTGPITVSFGGPFQTLGAGKLPASNFVVSVNALGQNLEIGIISTGTAGYVTFQGASYQMPAATFQKLESGFGQLASTPGASSASGTLGKLGIQPLHWLTNPTVVGTENVGGAQTTHIHAGVNVNALLTDLNTVLEKASSLGVSGASSLKSGIPAADRTKIAAEIKNPSVDIWTGTSDKTLRRLTINVTLPVPSKTSSQLGGLTSANVILTLQYSDLNQPQTIKAPATVLPFSQFQSKLSTLIQTVQGAASGMLGGSSSSGSGSGSSSSGGTTTGSSANVAKYSQCIQSARGDVAKMQKCASLLGG